MNVGSVSFQLSWPLHYLIYFFVGFAVGAYGFDRSLLANDGVLARHWAAWVAVALVGFLLWAAPTSTTMADLSHASIPQNLQRWAARLCLPAIGLRFACERKRSFDSLSVNAYGMYLVHYVFAVWLQYALLDAERFAIGGESYALFPFPLLEHR